MAKSTKPRRKGTRSSRTFVEQLAQATVPVVLAESTRVAIEKIATEVAREMLEDQNFRAELKEIVKRVSEDAVRKLRNA